MFAMAIYITYLFRKPRPGAFSIENLFLNIQKEFTGDVVYANRYMSKPSSGLINRIFLCFEAFWYQKGINHITGDINFISLLLKKDKTVLTLHDIDSLFRRNWLSNLLLTYFWLRMPIARVKWITVVSQETKNKLTAHIAVNPDKVIVIPNVISPEYKYVAKPFAKEKPAILQVGTKYNKNVERTIEALKGITCKFIIVGKISDQQRQLLKRYNIEYTNKVGVSDEELRVLFIDADIITFASLFEGFGLPILEAQATGRPVITSNCSSMPEVAGDAALFVDPHKVDEIRRAVLTLINNEKLRDRLIEKGLENCKRFHNSTVAQLYLELYKKM